LRYLNLSEGTESKFNEGIAKLQRIGYQRSLIMMFRSKAKWSKLLDCLINIRSEIWERLVEAEKMEVKNFEKNLRKNFMIGNNVNLTMLENYEDRLQELCYKYKISSTDKDDILEPDNF